MIMQRKSGNFFTGLVWTIVIVALGCGGFVAYERWWGTPEFKEHVSRVEQKAGETLGMATEWVTSLVKQSAKEKVGDVIVSASDSLGAYGEQMKEPTSPITGAIGASVDRGSVPIEPSIGISVFVASPLSFFLPPSTAYSVDWGDGKKEGKTLSAINGTTVTHAWSASGSYVVAIEVRNGERVSTESFPITVIAK